MKSHQILKEREGAACFEQVLLMFFYFSSPWLISDLQSEDLSEPLLIQVNPMCIEIENGFQ